MKEIIADTMALLGGIGIGFWLFALAFTRNGAAFWSDAKAPLALAIVLSFSLTFIDAKGLGWLIISILLSFPTVGMSSYNFMGVMRAGRGMDMGWPQIAGTMLACCLAGSLLAKMIRRRSKPTEKPHAP